MRLLTLFFFNDMSILLNIVLNIFFAFFGYYLGRYLDRKKREKDEAAKLEVERKHGESLEAAFVTLDYSNKYGIFSLAHGVPTFPEDDIYLRRTVSESFYYPIPEGDTKKTLAGEKYKFTQSGSIFRYTEKKNCLSPRFSKTMIDKINTGLKLFGTNLEDSKAELEEIANEVANRFLSDLNEGKPRFNGAMFGVSFFSENRDPENDEAPTVTINYYTTDYFTFRVFANYYQKHKDSFLAQHTHDLPVHVNELAFPFLSSFGVCCLIVLSYHDSNTLLMDDDRILLGIRSNNVIVDKGRVHFSMNEAFSLRDTIQGGIPDFKECINRGLKEENGLIVDRMNGAQFGDYHFLDFNLDSNKCEMGVTCYVKVVLDPETMTADGFKDDFFARYRIAQDGRLETTGFEMVKLGELEEYTIRNGERMSNGLRSSLEMFIHRYKCKMLK